MWYFNCQWKFTKSTVPMLSLYMKYAKCSKKLIAMIAGNVWKLK